VSIIICLVGKFLFRVSAKFLKLNVALWGCVGVHLVVLLLVLTGNAKIFNKFWFT